VNTRVFFASDVHGSERCFRKFINAAKFYEANVLILAGDLTGKIVVPIVEGRDGRFRLNMRGGEVTTSKEKVPEYVTELRDSGIYCFVTTESELEELKADGKKSESMFLEQMKTCLASWVALAEERLKGTEVKCYISPGNDDKFELDPILKQGEHVLNPENEVVEITRKNPMLTLGYSNVTPWHSPRELPEEELKKMIGRLADSVEDHKGSIFNVHVPPYGTEIDRAPAVDDQLRYKREGMGTVKMTHVGSTAVRESIEKYQPMLGMHGHVHEARGFVKIGRTLCLNPGSDYGDGVLNGGLLSIEDGGLKEFVLTSG
jgi:Icc-related predicted phosphoesterase